MSRGEKEGKAGNYMERNQTPESSVDLVGVFCDLWFYFLLPSAGRMDHGISKLQTEGRNASFQMDRA